MLENIKTTPEKYFKQYEDDTQWKKLTKFFSHFILYTLEKRKYFFCKAVWQNSQSKCGNL